MARGYRSSRQNLEAVGTGSWISRMCPFQIRWAARSSLLRRPARELGVGGAVACARLLGETGKGDRAAGSDRVPREDSAHAEAAK